MFEGKHLLNNLEVIGYTFTWHMCLLYFGGPTSIMSKLPLNIHEDFMGTLNLKRFTRFTNLHVNKLLCELNVRCYK